MLYNVRFVDYGIFSVHLKIDPRASMKYLDADYVDSYIGANQFRFANVFICNSFPFLRT